MSVFTFNPGVVKRTVRHALSVVTAKKQPRFVILGSGRSGSGYISKVLTECGIPCGHESWWNPHGRRQRGLVGDSSWCALALVDWSKYRGKVFHQVRHPLDVISSYVHRQSFTSPFAQIKLPLLAEDPAGDPLRYGCRIWLDLNRRSAELATMWWRVEDVDAQLVRKIGELLEITPHNVEPAIHRVSTSYNSHGTQRRLGWQDLPSDLVGQIEELARHFGYSRNEQQAPTPRANANQRGPQRRAS